MRKLVIGAAAAAGLVGGSIAVAAVSPLGSALARPTTVQAGQATDPTSPPSTPPGNTTPGKRGAPDRGAHIDEALQGLVDNGTITVEQRDAVRQALLDHMSQRGHGRRGEGRRVFPGMLKDGLDMVANRIGISADDLMTELRAGQSIADVARAHGVDPQLIVNDLVSAGTTKIDEAVAAGKLPTDKAEKIKGELPEMMQKLVDHRGPMRGLGHRPGGEKGPHPDESGSATPPGPPSTGTPVPDSTPSTTVSPPSTTAVPPSTAAGEAGGSPGTTTG